MLSFGRLASVLDPGSALSLDLDSRIVPPGFDPIAPIPVDATAASITLGVITIAPTAVTPVPSPSPSVPSPSPSAVPELADTGADVAAPVIAASGVLAILVGLALTLAARRRTAPRR